MAEQNPSTDFLTKMTIFNNNISNTKYIIEVSKLCGYSEFLFVFKEYTLLDLYKNVSFQFICKDINCLFIRNEETKVKFRIPITELITIREFITDIQNSTNMEIKNMLKPVYPLPNPIVYRIYLDDCHCHDEHCCP
jgi:hypothetical protein